MEEISCRRPSIVSLSMFSFSLASSSIFAVTRRSKRVLMYLPSLVHLLLKGCHCGLIILTRCHNRLDLTICQLCAYKTISKDHTLRPQVFTIETIIKILQILKSAQIMCVFVYLGSACQKFRIQLSALAHQPLLTIMGFSQGLLKLLKLYSKAVQRRITAKFLHDLSRVSYGNMAATDIIELLV